MAWFQGYNDEFPRPNSWPRFCIEQWIKLNPDWTVNVLTYDNIKDFVPEFFDIVKQEPTDRYVITQRSVRGLPTKGATAQRMARESDLLRLLLLNKFGGVWADASLLPVKPLSEFYDEYVNETEFFSYRHTKRWSPVSGTCVIDSFFLCVKRPKHILIKKWLKSFKHHYVKEKKWLYYMVHQAATNLYDKDEEIKYIIDNMHQVDIDVPHSASRRGWNNRRSSPLHKRPSVKDRKRIMKITGDDKY